MRKLLKTKLYNKNLIKRINTWAAPPCKILWTIFKVDKEKTSTNGYENKKTHDNA